MLSSLRSALRETKLSVATSLCPREHKLPTGDSSLDREWRLGLYRALQKGDARFYANRCDLGELFEPDSIHVFTSSQKGSQSDAVILAGVLAPPQNASYAERYATSWSSIKCDVIVKASFPKIYDLAPENQISALNSEIRLYNFLSQLVEKKVTPNLVLGLGVFDCTFDQLIQSAGKPKVQESVQQLTNEAQTIYKQREQVFSGSDPVRMLLLERGRGFSLADGIESGQIKEHHLISLSFQILYTLDVLSRRNIRHGDLHVANVFIDILSDPETEIAYFPMSESSNIYYQIPTYGFVAKLYDWDWGGVYQSSETSKPMDAWPKPDSLIVNAYACETFNRKQFGACGANKKADCFTLFTNLYDMPQTFFMREFRHFLKDCIDSRLLSAAFTFGNYGGFPYRACQGPISDHCTSNLNDSILLGNKCNGPWEPPDCLMKSPFDMMQHELFANYRFLTEKRLPTTLYVYGNWQSELQYKKIEKDLLAQDQEFSSELIAKADFFGSVKRSTTKGKKSSGKKASARKATGKKASGKKASAKKATGKKASSKKASARKASGKKASGKKASARKASSKKASAKKTSGKKASAKKASAKKASGKKASSKKASGKEATKKRKRVSKDDGHHVKRAKSAYIFYSMDQQKQFAKGIPVTERAPIIAAAWAKLTAAQKKPYETKAAADKLRSARERAALKVSATKKG